MEKDDSPIGGSIRSVRGKLVAGLVIAAAIVGGASWYFLYFTKTPAYALSQLRASIEDRDLAKFNRYVDLNGVLTRSYDDLIGAFIDSDRTITPEAKQFVGGFAQMFKAPIVDAFKEAIERYVETGQWQAEDETDEAGRDAKSPKINPEQIADQSGVKNAAFKNIAYVNIEGKTAAVGVTLLEKELNQEFTIEFLMRQLDDGTWQIAEISNMKAFVAAIREAESALLKRYLDDTAPLEQYAQAAELINAKLENLIVQSNLADPAKSDELRAAIADELIPNLEAQIKALNQIAVPGPARALHELRLTALDLQLKYANKRLEWLSGKDPLVMKEASGFRREAAKADEQAKAMIADIAAKSGAR